MLHLINCIALALFAVYIANSYTDYKLGWKNASGCEYHNLEINCTGGGCEDGGKKYMPKGGCSTNEYNIRLFITECHGKPACSVNRSNEQPNPCYDFYKWAEVWYECVPVQDLLVTSPSTQTPNNPVLGGFDEYGRDLFVGRAFKDNNLLPCYVTPGSYCVFSNNDVTDGNNTFDYLVGGVVYYANGPKYSWLRNHRGEVPPAAVTLGQTKDGDPLFVGRAEFGSGLYIGKVVPNQGLYIGLGGRSMFFPDYEILVQ
ncbi:hypothetical protein GE061_020131 [Apolygus lucorum]|uniref:SUEL-type lectin domain-containing protein n=1 Tax=Apolygus lucorum TaxID=248454 RepID=A0A8S9WPZ9_APOLU|nr:hypothetical protein GE061_020131 [Apolygus lucorum]